ncbi:MAG TPA: hypothetical protein VGO93_05200 [Candidatus Xenobia bacterium]
MKYWLGLLLVAAILIPGFAQGLTSGVEVGGRLSSYGPKHLTGPDKGTNTCPVCRYGLLPSVQVWVNTDKAENVVALAAALHQAVQLHGGLQAHGGLHAFITVLRPQAQFAEVESLASQANYHDVAIMWLDPCSKSVSDYQINMSKEVANTVFVSSENRVRHKFVNLVADAKGLAALQSAISDLF